MAASPIDATTASAGGAAPHPQSVARYLVAAVPTARPDEPAGDTRARLAGRCYDDASHVFLVAGDGRLAGVAAIGEVIGAAATTPLAELARSANVLSLLIYFLTASVLVM